MAMKEADGTRPYFSRRTFLNSAEKAAIIAHPPPESLLSGVYTAYHNKVTSCSFLSSILTLVKIRVSGVSRG